jgi:hypothetical protein
MSRLPSPPFCTPTGTRLLFWRAVWRSVSIRPMIVLLNRTSFYLFNQLSIYGGLLITPIGVIPRIGARLAFEIPHPCRCRRPKTPVHDRS